jgi:hypothetical protein
MATVTILSSIVQGLPDVITLTGSTVVPLASAVNVIQVGTGYFFRGAVVDTTLIGNAGVIAALTAEGAIQ